MSRIEAKISTLISDFSRVLLHYQDPAYDGGLNARHRELAASDPSYYILNHFWLNTELLDYYANLKARELRVLMYTSETIQDDPALAPTLAKIFAAEDIFSAQKLGLDKKTADGYRSLLGILELTGDQTIFVDDFPANVAAAAEAGMLTVQYHNNQQAIAEIEALLK